MSGQIAEGLNCWFCVILLQHFSIASPQLSQIYNTIRMARVLQLERDSTRQLGFQRYQDMHFLSGFRRLQNPKYLNQEN